MPDATLKDRQVLLGVTGGIAAYKSLDLARRLQDAGASVRVVMTQAATRFVTAQSFQAISGDTVRVDIWDDEAEAAMGHIELARWADLIIVAPASADFMARLAAGMADDLLSTLCLASDAPIFLAPAMNRLMWANAATKNNAQLLEDRGVRLIGPGVGSQACGEQGPGRMTEPVEIVAELEAASGIGPDQLRGKHVVITAGPTRERLDPVRYLSNYSSGKMGFAIARAARAAGAQVTLIAGPVSLTTPGGVQRVDVESAAQMHRAVKDALRQADIFIATAAVSDYRSAATSAHKIKKQHDSLSVKLEPTPDILSTVAASADRPFCVGFAAETRDVVKYAQQKLRAKKLDMIVANRVGEDNGALVGFDADDNELVVLWPDGRIALERASKTSLGCKLIALIADRYEQAKAGSDSRSGRLGSQ